MPNSVDHIQRAQNNEEFYRSFDLDTTPYIDWAVTSLFYAALHYVDAGLHEHRTRANPQGIHPEVHEDRTPAVQHNFPRLYRNYRELKSGSEDARYNLKPFSSDDVLNLERQEYMAIRQSMRNRLGLT